MVEKIEKSDTTNGSIWFIKLNRNRSIIKMPQNANSQVPSCVTLAGKKKHVLFVLVFLICSFEVVQWPKKE